MFTIRLLMQLAHIVPTLYMIYTYSIFMSVIIHVYYQKGYDEVHEGA